jgi:ribonuclease T2
MHCCLARRGSFIGALAAVLGALALILPAPALAQRGFSTGPGPSPFGGTPSGRHAAGRFDYYTLSLSWSPTYCASARRPDTDLQCAPRRRPRPYAFVLHGLWPQFERGGAPDSCPYSGRVPQRTIDGMLDIMPAPGLVIHEFRKHGSCSGLDPDAFYKLARRLHDKVAIPDSFQHLQRARFVSPADLVREFVAANPGLRPDMMAVSCGNPGDRLREVRVCFNRNGEFTRCGENENQRRLCRSQRMYVPPVRGGEGGAPAPSPGGREILPMPK